MTEPSAGTDASDVQARRAAAIERIRSVQKPSTQLDAELRQYQHRTSQDTRKNQDSGDNQGARKHQRARDTQSNRQTRHSPPRLTPSRTATTGSRGPRSARATGRRDVDATSRSYAEYERDQSERPDTDTLVRTRSSAGSVTRFRRLVRRYGWRAYALPILVIVTIIALASTDTMAKKGIPAAASAAKTAPTPVGPSPAAASAALKEDTVGQGAVDQPLVSDVLPAGADYTVTGNGQFSVIPGTSPVMGTGRLYKYTIDVEGGITGVDLAAFVAVVQSTLADSRSWVRASNVALQRVDNSSAANFHISLTSSMTVRNFCGYDIPVETSCYSGSNKRVVENVARWVRGDLAYVGDLDTYHLYMVNHEVGHALGHQHSHVCLSDGLAPAMMQQTLGLKSISGQICGSNPWPYPLGAADAPGIESADTPANSPVQVPSG